MYFRAPLTKGRTTSSAETFLDDILAENDIPPQHGPRHVVFGPSDGRIDHFTPSVGRDYRGLERSQVHADEKGRFIHDGFLSIWGPVCGSSFGNPLARGDLFLQFEVVDEDLFQNRWLAIRLSFREPILVERRFRGLSLD